MRSGKYFCLQIMLFTNSIVTIYLFNYQVIVVKFNDGFFLNGGKGNWKCSEMKK